MDLKANPEQRMLCDSLRRYLESEYPFEFRRALARSGGGFSRDAWRALADMGVLGLTIAPEYGGFGHSAASQMLVQHELGRALVLEPVTASAVMAAAILHETGYLLSGRKMLVWHGEAADALLVTARVAGEGLALFLVPTTATGLRCEGYPTIDGMRACDVVLQDVKIRQQDCVGQIGEGGIALEYGLEHGIAALCAEAGGAMERLIELTSEHLRTRQQFGKPLGSFQALQHRVADMLVQKEMAVSMAFVAARALSETNPAERGRMLAAAKFMTAKAGRFVGQQAVQLHGGMGMTDELAVGDYFKRLTMLDPLLGDSDYQLGRYKGWMAAAA